MALGIVRLLGFSVDELHRYNTNEARVGHGWTLSFPDPFLPVTYLMHHVGTFTV